MTAETLDRGRKAFGRQTWTDAFTYLCAADQEVQLEPEDLARLATAAYLIGKDAESEDFWARAYHQFLSRGEAPRAARCAFWLAFELFHHGEQARGGAWLARARRLLDEGSHDCVEQGYVLLPIALQALVRGDVEGADEKFCLAAQIGDRFGDPDLIALARHSRGRVLIRKGEIDEGVRLLDEAMLAVDAREVSPLVAGDVYCSVIEGCMEIFDLRRAREWTAALTRWCESQPGLVPFSGQCLTRRAELLQLHGAWPEAIEAASRACGQLLLHAGQPASGAAFYQCGELHRLRGEFAAAEEAFREASRYGRTPQPGMALLRLAQGQTEAAGTAIRLSLDQARDHRVRLRLLPAFIEIMLAAADLQAARSAADELENIANQVHAPYPLTVAAQARGAVLLAEGDSREALAVLRQAWAAWQETESPYEAARVRVLIGRACRDCGDKDAAEMEFDAAHWIFEQLGARPDLARLESLAVTSKSAAGLSAREVQVLRLVAEGKTNRAIASELFISERTVERHVSNIFLKLDVSSRAAATACAYQRQLI